MSLDLSLCRKLYSLSLQIVSSKIDVGKDRS